MSNAKNLAWKPVKLNFLAFSIMVGLSATCSVNAAQVSGVVTISIDNAALTPIFLANNPGYTAWSLNGFYDCSQQKIRVGYGSTLTIPNSTETQNLKFPVNSNTTKITVETEGKYKEPRQIQATTMDASNTSVGQIGLCGALRYISTIPSKNPNTGVITYSDTYLSSADFRLQKYKGVWNLASDDFGFGVNTFYQLTNVQESLNAKGELLLSGDLIFGDVETSILIQKTNWGGFVGALKAGKEHVVVGHLSLEPSTATPTPTITITPTVTPTATTTPSVTPTPTVTTTPTVTPTPAVTTTPIAIPPATVPTLSIAPATSAAPGTLMTLTFQQTQGLTYTLCYGGASGQYTAGCQTISPPFEFVLPEKTNIYGAVKASNGQIESAYSNELHIQAIDQTATYDAKQNLVIPSVKAFGKRYKVILQNNGGYIFKLEQSEELK
ncbi:MAG: hypothetical protein ABL903_16180 [Methylococcales bacterium]